MKHINIDLLHRDLWYSSIFQLCVTFFSIQRENINSLIAGVFISFAFWCGRAFVKNGIGFPGGIPNIITFSRLILLCICTILFKQFTLFQLGILYSFICIADIFDGYFARKLNQASILGEYLDRETDATFVLVLCILIYLKIHHSYWVLIPGLIRYFYFVAIYFFMDGDKKEHKDPWARVIAVFLFIVIIGQFLLPLTLSKPILLIAVILILYSFSRSIYYQLNLFHNK